MSGGRSGNTKWIARTIFLRLLGAAVVTELREPQEERTWHGKLAGFVPYEHHGEQCPGFATAPGRKDRCGT